MNWVTIIWSMVGASCLTLATVNLLVWCRKRTAWANLLFSSTAVATAAMAFCELRMMRADTPAQFGAALSWLHVSGFILIISLVGFVLFYMRAGRPWLAWATCILRAFSLLLNFLTGQNLNYREVTGLRHIPFLGESISVGAGVSNPWMLVGQLSLLLFVIFVADAAITVWRRGDQREVLVTGVSIVFFVVIGTVQSILVLWQIVHWPYAPSLCFLGIVAAMAYEMSREALRAPQLAEELQESERRLSLAANAARLCLWVWDVGRDDIWTTPEGRALFGFTATERIDLARFFRAVHSEDRGAVQHAVATSLAEDVEYEREYRIVLPSGQIRWFNMRGRVERSDGGPAIRVRGVAIDISERKRTEEKMRQLTHAIEQGPVLVVITDNQGKITYVNHKFTAVTGYSAAEILGQNPRLLKSGESSPAMYRELWAFITNGKTWHGEFHNRKKNGELYWESAVISPLCDASGRITHFVGIKEDITERKKTEAELLRERSELAHVARVSTMGELAASMAHELNQPLGSILANAEAAELFLQQNPPALDDLRAILTDIRKDDERAGEVIRRMRALLRKRELERQPLEINSLVEDTLQFVSGDAALRGVSLTADLLPGLPKIAGDRVHLQQVLLNLILNGMDAVASQPRARRRVSVRTRLGGDGRVELAVMDSGPGIDPDKLSRLFEPFYTTKPNGMGMGLSIVRTIIEAHQGLIWAENNLPGGAVFRITLPIIQEGTKP